jgi:hypothetical protein
VQKTLSLPGLAADEEGCAVREGTYMYPSAGAHAHEREGNGSRCEIRHLRVYDRRDQSILGLIA